MLEGMRRPVSAGVAALICSASWVAAAWAGEAEALRTSPSAFLFQVAMEYHAQGRDADAIGELRNVLLIHPTFSAAQHQFTALSQHAALRDAVIEATLDRLTAQLPN